MHQSQYFGRLSGIYFKMHSCISERREIQVLHPFAPVTSGLSEERGQGKLTHTARQW